MTDATLALSGEDVPVEESRVALSSVEQLHRVSVALRGVKPSLQDIDQVMADPAALEPLVDGYLESEAFTETIRDLYAETLRIRWEGMSLPSWGPLEGTDTIDVFTSMSEEPLRLIEHVVLSDAPLTEAVTADYVFVDEVAALMYGFDGYDEAAGGVQKLGWEDDRPAAGFLSANSLWIRHASNGSNYHRGRANLLADALLCEDFLSRDVPITGTVDLADDAAVADAVQTLPECVSCHQSLDPLAAHLWGFKKRTEPGQITIAYNTGCTESSNTCYPLTGQYDPSVLERWHAHDLRGPSYYGQESHDLADLGALVAEDPRFSLCTARRFYGFFGAMAPRDVPFDVAASLQRRFIDSGLNAKALARAVVLSDSFLAAYSADPEDDATLPGMLVVRPRQQARIIDDLTGFRWMSDTSFGGEPCTDRCWGEIDRSTHNGHGFQAMSGGSDGYRVSRAIDTVTPIKVLFSSALAEEAAAWVVMANFDRGEGRLLAGIDPQATDEPTVRAAMVDVYLRALGSEPTESDVDGLVGLFADAAEHAGPREGWRVVVTALLQHPRVLFY